MDAATLARLRRAERWWLLDRLRPLAVVDRLRRCRRVTLTGTGGPVLRVDGDRGAGYAGLETCGSVWACPCCAPKIAARRSEQLSSVLSAVHAVGGSAYLLTLTMRHNRSHRLRDLWSACSAAWGRVTSGRQWETDSRGLLGWARVVEVTHSEQSGWHVHVHALLTWDHDVDDDHAAWIAMRAWRRWDNALRRRGLDSTPVRGLDARRVRAGDEALGGYFNKAAAEITTSHMKTARSGGRSPFDLARDAADTYRESDVLLWWEFQRSSHGRRQLEWSRGRLDLRTFAGVRDATDEEIAAEETGGRDLVALTDETWSALTRAAAAPELLDVAETGGVTAATDWLDARGLTWSVPVPAPLRPRSTAPSPQLVREARAVLRPADPPIDRQSGRSISRRVDKPTDRRTS